MGKVNRVWGSQIMISDKSDNVVIDNVNNHCNLFLGNVIILWVTYSPYLYVSYFLLKQKRYNKFCHFPLCYSSLRACKHFFLNHRSGTFLLCIFTVCTYLFGWTLNILYPKSTSERNPFLMMRVYILCISVFSLLPLYCLLYNK